jgi:hypothetical protein
MKTHFQGQPEAASMKHLRLLCAIAVSTGFLYSSPSWAFTATVNFDTFPNGSAVPSGTALDNQYAADGVWFDYEPLLPTVTAPPFSLVPSSPPNVCRGPDLSEEFIDGDFKIHFISTQSSVQLNGGTLCHAVDGELTAYDAAGTPLTSSGRIPLNQGATTVPFKVEWGTADISYVAFHAIPSALVGNCDEAIDDLVIVGNPPPSPFPPPVITITTPPPQVADYTTQPLQLTGTYSGTQLLSNMQVDFTSLDTAAGQPTTRTSLLPLSQTTGSNIPYSSLLDNAGQLPIGHYSITATIKDPFAQGQATTNFSNFPPALSGLEGTLGPFRFALPAGNCQIVFYQTADLAVFPNGTTRAVPTAVAEKWRTVNSPIISGTLGCPISDADSDSEPGWTVQAFERGSIYVPPSDPAVWTPTVLTDALAKLSEFDPNHLNRNPLHGQFRKIGWPAGDPDWYLDTQNPTWVLQRFAHDTQGSAYQNTLEIRGRQPTLYAERIGGDPDELIAAQDPPDAGAPRIEARTPTVWQTFPCTMGASWPTSCDLTSLLVPIPVGHPGATFCEADPGCDMPENGSCDAHNCPGFLTTSVGEWVDTGAGNTDLTLYHGVIKDKDPNGTDLGSHFANNDLFLNHQICIMTDKAQHDVAVAVVSCGVASTLGGALENLAGALGTSVGTCIDSASSLQNDGECRSDWNLHTRPLRTPQDYGFLAASNTNNGFDDMELEFEEAYAAEYFARFVPGPGDLVTAHGRPVVDCGHCPYHGEIHPPDMLIVERSFVGGLGNLPLVRQTDAYVWGNAFLPVPVPGQPGAVLPLSASAHAPPRISATSHLVVQQHEFGYWRFSSSFPVSTGLGSSGGEMVAAFSGNSPGWDISDGEWGVLNFDSLTQSPSSTPFGTRFADHWQINWEQ